MGLSSDLIPDSNPLALAKVPTERLRQAADKAAEFLGRARSQATRRAQASDWRLFEAWARAAGAEPLPAQPALVALWVGHLAGEGRKLATIRRSLATISVVHRRAKHPSPTQAPEVQEVLRGAAVTLGAAQVKAAPLLPEHLLAMFQAMVDAQISEVLLARNRVALVVGWAGALRRSELVALNFNDIKKHPKGLEVVIRSSKTDQAGEGASVALFPATDKRLCPVEALEYWAVVLGAGRVNPTQDEAVRGTPVVRRMDPTGAKVQAEGVVGRAIDDLVKHWAAKAKLEPEGGTKFSAHSLRAGFVTTAGLAGRPEWQIARQTRHRKLDVLRGYLRVPQLFDQHPAEGLL